MNELNDEYFFAALIIFSAILFGGACLFFESYFGSGCNNSESIESVVNAIVLEKTCEETKSSLRTATKYRLKFKEEDNPEQTFSLDCKYILYSSTDINDSLKVKKTIVYKGNEIDRIFYDFLE